MAREPIARLREDLEVHHRQNGTVDVRDPFLLQIYTLDADDFRVAQTFEGTSSAELADKLRKNPLVPALDRGRPTVARIREVAEEFDDLKLLDRPEVWKAEPNVDNVSPYSQIGTKRGLRVLPAADPTAHWTCHGCGSCCHGLAVEISAEEESRIDAKLYQDILHGEDFAEDSFLNPDEPAKRTLKQRWDDNNACIFLAPDGLCYVHARQGMSAKPDACQMFPSMVMMVPGEKFPRLGVRTNCSSMYKSYDTGPAVAELVPHVMRVLAKGEVHTAPKKVKLFGRKVPFRSMDRISREMREAFDRDGLNAQTIMALDKKLLGGRVKKTMRRYGKMMLSYLQKEQSGPAPVEEGAYNMQIRRLRRGMLALEEMQAGHLPGPVPRRIEAFLRSQIGHVLYISGPLNLPDAGHGFIGILLGLLAALHAIGEIGTLKTANTAFEVFMMPVLETIEHSWPILDAIDARYAERLRQEV